MTEAELEVRRLSKEVTDLQADHVGLMRVSGALCDAGTIPVPNNPLKYADAVRALTKERDSWKARADEWGAKVLAGDGADIVLDVVRADIPRPLQQPDGSYESTMGTIRRVVRERDQLQAQVVALVSGLQDVHVDGSCPRCRGDGTECELLSDTASAAQAFEARVKAAALEEAAKRCDAIAAEAAVSAAAPSEWPTQQRYSKARANGASDCGAAVRTLIPTPTPPETKNP